VPELPDARHRDGICGIRIADALEEDDSEEWMQLPINVLRRWVSFTQRRSPASGGTGQLEVNGISGGKETQIMKLTIEVTTTPLLKPGQQVSLSNNGSGEVRVCALKTCQTVRVFSPTITCHMDDEETTIELQGYIDAEGGSDLRKEVSILLT